MEWASTPASQASTSTLGIPDDLGRHTVAAGPQWGARDPRTSSTQSLVPSTQDGNDHGEGRKRKLLVVYIHGFMGDNSSFRSFPAHVHAFLKTLLAETHVIHSKIYPRYKTYKSIGVARDNFSQWLAPHESPTTDVILVGHSMGGLLAADVVLLPNQSPYGGPSPFRHRILGTISLDAPLLGLHPGIVVSGIASLFRPTPAPPTLDNQDSQTDHLSPRPSQDLSPDPSIYSEVSPPPGTASSSLASYQSNSTVDSSSLDYPDPLFNPPFANDVAFVDRGWFKNVLHFANKHRRENLVNAAASHIVSHLEFGACLADYPQLNIRYNKLRKLEDVEDLEQSGRPRVRFVNYYTISTGFIKPPKPPSPHGPSSEPPEPAGDVKGLLQDLSSLELKPGEPPLETDGDTPRISVEYDDGSETDSLQILEPMPEPEPEPGADSKPDPTLKLAQDVPETKLGSDSQPDPGAEPISEAPNEKSEPHPEGLPQDQASEPDTKHDTPDDHSTQEGPVANNNSDLPPIPDVPIPPETPEFEAYPDKESRKQAEKTHKAAQKAYSQAIKARDKAIKDCQKALEKQQRKALKLEKKQAKLLAKSGETANSTSNNPLQEEDDNTTEAKTPHKPNPRKEKPPRRRKFCMLPPKSNSVVDPTWVEVYMEGVDEVGAHCGLFFPGPHYERLVGDVGDRIAGWVWEDATRRVLLEEKEAGGV
ncbi:uncharacterized protein C8A04DRAFT_28523 [Dichotomopilus funicola]|uniref:AB hydrolase-1 domain-containing protein n=1 Tax=Dichotomopilus funicola TaxID=1934379 RepID=A0AAN6ZN28_9PEZI|nr:hypothetical protein C8A04DRAFT_28523 [Dichotomopilus funicola]